MRSVVSINDIPSIRITSSEMNLVKMMARAAERGGVSHIRTDDRAAMLGEDQIVGQIGALAGHKYWFGNIGGYLQSRHVANTYPDHGDGGSDVIGANIDFKASRIRSDRLLFNYHLPVRTHERSEGKIYVLVLVETDMETALTHLMGWATDDMLPEFADRTGPLKGAYTLRASDLCPMPPIHWRWVDTAIAAQKTI